MKNKVIQLFSSIILILLFSINTSAFNDLDLKSDGIEENPYLIYTIEDLRKIGNSRDWTLDKHYKLMNDIILEIPEEGNSNWIPIGTSTTPFTGVFDGNQMAIQNLTILNNNNSVTGLFGYVKGKNAIIENVKLIDINIHTESEVAGGIAGMLVEGTVKGCSVTGEISARAVVGGIIGTCRGFVDKCYSFATVTSFQIGGGLIGSTGHPNYKTIIQNSYSASEVHGGYKVGGLIGEAINCEIRNCYSLSRVYGHNSPLAVYLGGIIGAGLLDCIIENCYFAGSLYFEEPSSLYYINFHNAIGGIVGYTYDNIRNCIVMIDEKEVVKIQGLYMNQYYFGFITSQPNTTSYYLNNNYVFSNIIKENDMILYGYNINYGYSTIENKQILFHKSFYEELGWNFSGEDPVWEFSGNYKLPKLAGVGGQEKLITPSHLQ